MPDELDRQRVKERVLRNPLREGLAAHQLVGRVTAYQGEDG